MKINQRKAAITEIKRISTSQGGKITALQMFEMAQEDKSSPLRPIFQWNRKNAFEAHNVDLGRRFISSITVRISTETVEVKAVAYVRDPLALPREQGYLSVDRIKTDEDCKREALLAEFSRINGLMKRACDLAKYFEMDDEMKIMVNQIATMRDELQVEPRHTA
jgi:hypothetical protein